MIVVRRDGRSSGSARRGAGGEATVVCKSLSAVRRGRQSPRRSVDVCQAAHQSVRPAHAQHHSLGETAGYSRLDVLINLRSPYVIGQTIYIFILSFVISLWSPYVIGQTIIFSSCSFFLLLSIVFFPRLISAVGDWMFTILWHLVWP